MELMGVYDSELVEPLAQVLCNLGVKSAMVVHGEEGLDEISLCGPTKVCEVRNGWTRSYLITPEDFGFERCQESDLLGGSPQENAKILERVLVGDNSAAYKHKVNAAVLNAGAALYITGKYQSIRETVQIAKDVITSGVAKEKLREFIHYTNQ
jgi:anthranilate phosphoribosyltransferase